MSGHLAIAAYRGLINGEPSGSLDLQVRWFADEDAALVRAAIQSESAQVYFNNAGEEVRWELADILAIEPFDSHQSGDEVVGFITSLAELGAFVNKRRSQQ
ncbi:MAG: hypothetical protein SFU86_16600 [Pirellulaceae bacterium]|nr:hypothetical protein [Pirellulaceae bacterium]